MKTRKQQLTDRAYRYAYGVTRDELYSDNPESMRAANAWEDGYRAARRDMRKVVRDARRRTMAAGITNPFKRSEFRDLEQRVAVDIWLKPLR